MRGIAVAVVVAFVVVVSGTIPAWGAAPGSHERGASGDAPVGTVQDDLDRIDRPAAGTGTAGTIQMEYTVSLAPESPDIVRIRAVARLPASVEGFRVRLPEDATVESTDGFESGGDRHLQWNGVTASPSFTYTAPVDRRSDTFDGYVFTATREWALVDAEMVDVAAGWRYRGSDPGLSETVTVDGEGYVGESFVYLGPHEVYSRGDDPTVALVVPEGIEPRPTHDELFELYDGASDGLVVGGRSETVHVFVGTSPLHEGGRAGARLPEAADVWIHEDVPIRGASDTWLHEYVHTRQTYDETARMKWFDEASAEYYAAVLALRQDRTSHGAFRAHVGRSGEGTLTDQATWEDATVPYTKGSLVLAALEARIRDATDGDATLMDVFGRMNGHDGELTYAVFRDIVADVAGQRLDGWLDRYVAGPEAPPFPDDPAAFTDSSGARDPDEDGLPTAIEREHRTDPFDADTDGDGIDDGREQDRDTDPTAADTDDDGIRDGAEGDLHRTDPMNADTDGDGIQDGREVNLAIDPTDPDTDDDGLDDRREIEFGTDPTTADSDLDELEDGVEIDEHGTDPAAADTDDDGIWDGREVNLAIDPTAADTDDDGIRDGAEVNEHGTGPTETDTDDDGIEDGVEVGEYGTDPIRADTDGDGYADDRELDVGTDPADPTGTVAFWLAAGLDALGLVVRSGALPATLAVTAAGQRA